MTKIVKTLDTNLHGSLQSMICQQVTLSGDAEWPKVADAVIEALDPIGVDDAEHGRSGQEDLRPVVMGPQEAKEVGALGEAGKQGAIVARQPAIEGPVAHAFEGMEQSQGEHLTGPEMRIRVFGDGAHLLIDLVE